MRHYRHECNLIGKSAVKFLTALLAGCAATYNSLYPKDWPSIAQHAVGRCSSLVGNYRDVGIPAPTNSTQLQQRLDPISFEELVDSRFPTGFAKSTGGTDGVLSIEASPTDEYVVRLHRGANQSAMNVVSLRVQKSDCLVEGLFIRTESGKMPGENFSYRLVVELYLQPALDGSLIVREDDSVFHTDYGILKSTTKVSYLYKFEKLDS